MNRNILSLLLSMIFLMFSTAPTVITFVDDSIDVSIFYSTSEEEDNGIEKDSDTEMFFLVSITSDPFFLSKQVQNKTSYYFKKYNKFRLNLISPPPDLG